MLGQMEEKIKTISMKEDGLSYSGDECIVERPESAVRTDHLGENLFM